MSQKKKIPSKADVNRVSHMRKYLEKLFWEKGRQEGKLNTISDLRKMSNNGKG